MLKIFVSVAFVAIVATAGQAEQHSRKALELTQLVDEHGLEAAVVAGILMGDSMTPKYKESLMRRIGGEDSFDICAWCFCCLIKNGEVETLSNPQSLGVLEGLLE